MIKAYIFPRGFNGETWESSSELLFEINTPGILPIGTIIHLYNNSNNNYEQEDKWNTMFSDNEGFEYPGGLVVEEIFFTTVDDDTQQSIIYSCSL